MEQGVIIVKGGSSVAGCGFYSLGNYIADKSVDNFKRVEKLIVHEVDFFMILIRNYFLYI